MLSVTPAHRAADVGVVTPVTVEFSEPVFPDSARYHHAVFLTRPDRALAVKADAVLAGATLTITPRADFDHDARYQVHVSTVVEDLAGNRLVPTDPVLFSFTTERFPGPLPDLAGPMVVESVPAPGATGVHVGGAIRISVTEPLDSETVFQTLPASIALLRIEAGSVVEEPEFSVSLEDDDRTLRLTPANPLAPSSSYRVLLSRSITDRAHHPLAGGVGGAPADFVLEFVTADSDAVSPSVTA